MKIITLTLSPALDVTYALAGEVKRGLNRALSHSLTAGGKGINVARAIMREAEILGRAAQVSALYPSGGVTGDLLSSALAMEGISTIAVKTAENCRINVSAISSDSEDVEINARGAAISEVELSKIESELDVLTEGDVLAICGSVPAGVEKSYYARLIRKMKDRGVICVLDCDGEALRIAVCGDCPPDYVKPNESEIDEFCESIGADVSAEAIVTASGGRCAVIATYGGSGAAIFTSCCSARVDATPVKPKRLKGAGDTLLGVYLYHRFVLREGEEASLTSAVKAAGEYVASEERKEKR